mmetsp:Transcript_12132/g.23188  ORF Transcript_12132/g.23188 Transcript_12132/m.23188 type:complete len:580 (-) Transcript_12132:262-2001(-)
MKRRRATHSQAPMPLAREDTLKVPRVFRKSGICTLPQDTLVWTLSFLDRDDLRRAGCVSQKFRDLLHAPNLSTPWRTTFKSYLKETNFFKALERNPTSETGDDLANSTFGLEAIGRFFGVYKGAGLREACYFTVDWPTQFNGDLVHVDPQHPHWCSPVQKEDQKGFPWLRVVYRGSLRRGDRALRADRPFPALADFGGLPDPFVMPIMLANDECEALRLYPEIIKCRIILAAPPPRSTMVLRSSKNVSAFARRSPPRISRIANLLRSLRGGSGSSKREAKLTSGSEKASTCQKTERGTNLSEKEAKSSNVPKITVPAMEFNVSVSPGVQLMFSTIAYFEVEIDHLPSPDRFDGNCVSIGLAKAEFPLTGKQPGWDAHSYGYHGDDGNIFHSSGLGRGYGQPFGPGDVVGCGLDYITRSIFFTKNGACLGTAFGRVPSGSYYPVVGVDTRAPFAINFGLTKPFIFKHGVYHQKQMERFGLLSSKNYPLHPLLPFLKERVVAGKSRYVKHVERVVAIEDGVGQSDSDEDEDEEWELGMGADYPEIPGRRHTIGRELEQFAERWMVMRRHHTGGDWERKGRD